MTEEKIHVSWQRCSSDHWRLSKGLYSSTEAQNLKSWYFQISCRKKIFSALLELLESTSILVEKDVSKVKLCNNMPYFQTILTLNVYGTTCNSNCYLQLDGRFCSI